MPETDGINDRLHEALSKIASIARIRFIILYRYFTTESTLIRLRKDHLMAIIKCVRGLVVFWKVEE